MTKETEGRKKVCFFIAPIDSEGSEVRIRSDQVSKYIVAPAAEECGYATIRADQIPKPGIITDQVIQHLLDDPLVVADLTGWNPNVFYELAIRHAIRKPVVQIIHGLETLPFDVATIRTIHYDHHDLDSVSKAREEIAGQIRAVEENPQDADNPITAALDLQQLRQSENPRDKMNIEIMGMLQEILEIVRGQGRRIGQLQKTQLGGGRALELSGAGLLSGAVARYLVEKYPGGVLSRDFSEYLAKHAEDETNAIYEGVIEETIAEHEKRRKANLNENKG